MRLHELILRWIALLFIASLPWLLVLGALAGVPGLIAAAGIGVSSAILLGFFPERIIARMHHAQAIAHAGLRLSLERAAAGSELPELLIFPDPAPNALVVRSLGGAGTLLLSRGLSASLDEAELRSVLQECLMRNERPEVLLQSLCALLASASLALVPGPRLRWILNGDTGPASRGARETTPLAFAALLAILPIARFWLRLGGGWGVRGAPDAMQKIAHSAAFWDLQARPGVSRLYLHRPWNRSNVLPF